MSVAGWIDTHAMFGSKFQPFGSSSAFTWSDSKVGAIRAAGLAAAGFDAAGFDAAGAPFAGGFPGSLGFAGLACAAAAGAAAAGTANANRQRMGIAVEIGVGRMGPVSKIHSVRRSP